MPTRTRRWACRARDSGGTDAHLFSVTKSPSPGKESTMRPTSTIHTPRRAVPSRAALTLVLAILSLAAFAGQSASAASPAAPAGASIAHSCPDFQAPNLPSVYSVRATRVTCAGARRIIVAFGSNVGCSGHCVARGFWCRETYGGGTETSGDSSYYVSCKARGRRVTFAHGI